MMPLLRTRGLEAESVVVSRTQAAPTMCPPLELFIIIYYSLIIIVYNVIMGAWQWLGVRGMC